MRGFVLDLLVTRDASVGLAIEASAGDRVEAVLVMDAAGGSARDALQETMSGDPSNDLPASCSLCSRSMLCCA